MTRSPSPRCDIERAVPAALHGAALQNDLLSRDGLAAPGGWLSWLTATLTLWPSG